MSSKAARFVRSDFIKSLIEVSNLEVTPPIEAELLSKFNLNYAKLPADVPFQTLVALLPWLHQKALPHLTFEAACNELGFRNVAYFLTTGVGKVYAVSTKILGRNQKIELFVRNLKVVFRWGDVQALYPSDTRHQIIVKDVPICPDFIAGMMRPGREVLEKLPVSIKIIVVSDEEFILEADW